MTGAAKGIGAGIAKAMSAAGGTRAIGAMSDEARAAHIARTPLGRVGTPADIASVAVFLASDDARGLTGECLAVSGGLR